MTYGTCSKLLRVRAAVLGAPIAHSLSPVLHRAAYQALGLTGWSYEAIECGETRLPAVLDDCGPDWAGLSLTMPLKRAVLPLLDETEPLAREVGAANTVVFRGGRRHGHNTDVPGMIAALAEAGVTGPPDPAPGRPAVLILGAGAADIYAGRIARGHLVPRHLLDVVYHPWPTALAEAARKADIPVAGGLALLLHQAAGQVTLMTGKPAPLPAMRQAGESALSR